MTTLGGALLGAGFLAIALGATFFALAFIRSNQAIENALDDVAYGDAPHLPPEITDAQRCISAMHSLYVINGGCSEVGPAFHSSINSESR